MIIAGLLALLLFQTVAWMADRRYMEKERSRLSRMAYAETPSERIAALIPEDRTKARETRSEIPRKPLGI